jgi:hypothetical protein
MYIFFMKVYLVIIMKMNIKNIDINNNKIYREFILVNVYKVKATIIICFSNCNNIF